MHDWARTRGGRLKEAETPTWTISRCYHERWRLKAHCHYHPWMKRHGVSPPNFWPFVCRLTTALVQWQRQHHTARTEESGCKQITPPRSFPVAQPGLPSFLPLSSSFCNHSWFPFFEAISLQEVDPFSSNIIKLAALVLVVVSTPPEELQPAPSLSKLEEGIVFPNFLQKASLVHVGFCKGYFHGLKLPLQLWHFL